MNYYSQAYPASASVSPERQTMQTAYSSVKGKFDAGRAFEFEDDAEFCPALSEEEIQFTRLAIQHGVAAANAVQTAASTPGSVTGGSATGYSPYASTHTTPPPSYNDMAVYYGASNQSPTEFGGSPIARNSALTNPNMMMTNNFLQQQQQQQFSISSIPRNNVAYHQPMRREQRPLEIVDPVTGRIASPAASVPGGYAPVYRY